MSKSPSCQDFHYKYPLFADSYVRQPIHCGENQETIDEEEEEEENDCEGTEEMNKHQKNNLYPSMEQELHRIRQEKLKDSKKKKTYKRPKQSVKSEKPVNQESSLAIKYGVSILIVIAAAAGVYFYSFPKKPSVDVTKLVADMQNHFRDQQSNTFEVLKLALKRVVNENPKPSAPAIFTIIANKGAENTASSFSIYLAKALAPEQFVSISESAQGRNNPELLKLKIDNEIKSKLDTEILNVVIVDRLNDIPIDAAMVFHGLCDHESAPYKRAVYLFIVHLNRSLSENSSGKHIDDVAMDSLRNIWLTSTADFVDSLITRLTVNVVNIT